MNTKELILKALIENGERFVSGEMLAQRCGVSRAAVWKAIQALRAQGYAVEAVTHRGYRLTEDNDLLSAERVRAALHYPVEVLCFSSIDSTNNEAKRLLAMGETRELLLVAEEQTAGRGRQGKQFYSPRLTGIYFSLVLHPGVPIASAVGITTAAAVAVCRAVEKLTDKRPQIKWVNDVYLNGKKICGILTEAVTDLESGTAGSVIVGIGMNIKTVHFPDSVENGGSLGASVTRAALIAAISDELYRLTKADYDGFLDEYRARSMLLGQEISFIYNGVVTPATAVEIDRRGGLVVRLKNGEMQTLTSGEISVRKKQAK